MKFYPSLTGIRGIACLWVFLFHAFQDQSLIFIKNGHLGVDLFFILSGFILSYVHAKDFFSVTLDSFYKFIALRIARIYPIHIFTLIFLLIVVLFSPNFVDSYQPAAFSLGNLLAGLFLVQTWITPILPSEHRGPGWSWNGPSWSLSAELMMYFLFPLISKILNHLKNSCHIFIVGLICLIMYCLFLYNEIELAGMPRAFFEFIAGCCIYHSTAKLANNVRLWNYVCFIVIILSPLFSLYFQYMYFYPFVFFIIIPAIAYGDNLLVKFCSSKVIVWLGDISLSLYLIHWPLLQIQKYYFKFDWFSSFKTKLCYLIFLCIIVFISHLTYVYLEVPSRAKVRMFLIRTRK